MLAATRAIVATGSYAPKGFAPEWRVPQGAEEADGASALIRVVRDQIGHGADWIKLYADYAWGPQPGSHPTFSIEEMKAAVEAARSAGVPVAAHAHTAEGMRRAVLAGVETIEHGDQGTPEVFKLMTEHHGRRAQHLRRAMRSAVTLDGRKASPNQRASRPSGPVSLRRLTRKSRFSTAATSSRTERTSVSLSEW